MRFNTTRYQIQFNTGDFGNSYATKKDAIVYAEAANRYSERVQGERVVRAIVRVTGGEITATYRV